MLPAPEAATAKLLPAVLTKHKHQTHEIQHPAPLHCTRISAAVQWKEYDFMAKRNAAGNGTIRKKTVKRNGKDYVFWEARYTVGTDPGTGKQIQRSISGKTQKEVAQKLKAATAALDAGTFIAPNKMTLGEWLDIWQRDYLGGVKPFTVASYTATIRNHIKPALGAIRLEALQAHTIQNFYNTLAKGTESRPALSAKTVQNIHGVLHNALKQAVLNKYIHANPTDACILPRKEKRQITPLDEDDIRKFLKAIQGHPLEVLFTVTLFTGMREGEVLGLGWEQVDFERGIIHIVRQLQLQRGGGGHYIYAPLKNDRIRSISPAPWIMQLLHAHKAAGALWENSGLVFTSEVGHHLAVNTVFRQYKAVVTSIGRPDARFHDLRHSYAVASIMAGDDIKTVQGNLGHATAAFTLDVYGHVTDQMRQASAQRMEQYIKQVLSQ